MLLFFSPIIIIFLTLISLFIIILIISCFELKTYKINEFYVKNNKNSEKFKIVYISDFHNKLYKNDNDDLVCDILNTNPDYIFLGGDFIIYSIFEGIFDKIEIDNAIKFIYKLKQKIDKKRSDHNYNLKRIFFSYGNHELRFNKVKNKPELLEKYNKFIEAMKECDIEILDNETLSLNDGATISSLSLYDGYYANIFLKKKYFKHISKDLLQQIFNNLDDKKYNIVMFHKPDYADDLLNFGFDFVLSGHNHGGLINFPIIGAIFSPEFRPFPKYNKGLYEVSGKNVLVSSGIGEHFLKIRVNNMPEICVVNIE